jgi:hypothetical protein
LIELTFITAAGWWTPAMNALQRGTGGGGGKRFA